MAQGTGRSASLNPTSTEVELVLVLTTEANRELAEKLAVALLEQGLVACVSLMPIVSLYRWEGQDRRDEEVQLLLKTNPSCLPSLYDAVLSLHSYTMPEWITLSGQSRGGYGHWCAEQLALSSRPSGQMVGHELGQ